MKKTGKLLSAAVAATIILGTTGCDTVRDYSVNSYQGVMPMSDFRPNGSVPTTITQETPKPSVPTPAPTAAPAAGASGSSTTKPGDASTK
jgi:hypothetical protein